MSTLQAISVTVIAAVMVELLFALFGSLQIRRTARKQKKSWNSAHADRPLSHDLTVISAEVNGILQSIHRQAES